MTTTIPACVPLLGRATIERYATQGYAFAFSKPDFAGQLRIEVALPRGGSFTCSIVGNDYERTLSYFTFVEWMQLVARDGLQALRRGARASIES